MHIVGVELMVHSFLISAVDIGGGIFVPRLVYRLKRIPVPIAEAAGWAPELSGRFWKIENPMTFSVPKPGIVSSITFSLYRLRCPNSKWK
jgi:hypothetical protein